MGIWEVIQKEIVDKPEISAELRTSWREQESMVLTLGKYENQNKTENRKGILHRRRWNGRKNERYSPGNAAEAG